MQEKIIPKLTDLNNRKEALRLKNKSLSKKLNRSEAQICRALKGTAHYPTLLSRIEKYISYLESVKMKKNLINNG